MIAPGFEEYTTSYRKIRFYDIPADNIDPKTVASFGYEWKAFHDFRDSDIESLGIKYFDIVTPEMLNSRSKVIDIGCGSGRFIKYLKGRYNTITGVDPSDAILVADELLGSDPAIDLVKASTDNLPFPDDHFDFGYSLGVLHHIPDTEKALRDCVKKIKPGGYFLLYLYYNLENRSWITKLVFQISNLMRLVISRFPKGLKMFTCDVLAALVYLPFAVSSRFLKWIGVPLRVRKYFPLQAYEDQRFFIMRNDCHDRFGTPLERRFSRNEIDMMMRSAGLTEIVFSENIPFWHAVGKKA
ncbi:MAG: class I SAM-dependent methyltransferase [Chitinophagaceae bacterium]